MKNLDKSKPTSVLDNILTPHIISFIHENILDEDLSAIIDSCRSNVDKALFTLALSVRNLDGLEKEKVSVYADKLIKSLAIEEVTEVVTKLDQWIKIYQTKLSDPKNKPLTNVKCTETLNIYLYHKATFQSNLEAKQKEAKATAAEAASAAELKKMHDRFDHIDEHISDEIDSEYSLSLDDEE